MITNLRGAGHPVHVIQQYEARDILLLVALQEFGDGGSVDRYLVNLR